MHWLTINQRIEYKLIPLTYKKFSLAANLHNLFSFQSTCRSRTRSSSAVTLARPSVVSSLQITNRSFDMHRLTCGISSLLHSVNLILFTVLLVHLILRISPHHSPHLIRSHHLSLPRPFTPDLKLICFTNPFLDIGLVFLVILDCLHGSSTLTGLNANWRLFVFFFSFLVLRVLD